MPRGARSGWSGQFQNLTSFIDIFANAMIERNDEAIRKRAVYVLLFVAPSGRLATNMTKVRVAVQTPLLGVLPTVSKHLRRVPSQAACTSSTCRACSLSAATSYSLHSRRRLTNSPCQVSQRSVDHFANITCVHAMTNIARI